MPEEQSKQTREVRDATATADDQVQGQAAERQAVANDPEALKQELDRVRAKSDEYLDNWRRAAADLANYRKRAEKEASETVRAANSVLILRLLPILDDFDRAFQTIPEGLQDLTWVDGIRLISRKMRAVLEAEGLKPIETLGKPFDPNLHEAVIHEETDKYEEGRVIGELQKGYMLHDRVLRPALVKVSKKKEQAAGE